ncbi:hypothetical protein IID62_10435 [candidate division KSB1 bacterium]|nr:hypothetical protein [candidate division KSB1 bacterium]
MQIKTITFGFFISIKEIRGSEIGCLFVSTEEKSIVEALRYLPGMLTGM